MPRIHCRVSATLQTSLLLLTFVVSALAAYGEATPSHRCEIDLQKQLLVDDYAVAETENVRRILGTVTKANDGQPVMTADKPWEDDLFGFYGTVLHDGERFRMWYHPWAYAVAYAESDDGLHWCKPELGIFDFSIDRLKELGSDEVFSPREGAPLDWRGKENNIIGYFGDGFTCFLDSRETDPEHRYKACYGPVPQICAAIAHSPDGIHWTRYNNGEPVTGRASDTYNQLLWDEGAKTYRLLTRTDFGRDGSEIRGCRVMVNPDVKANPTDWKTVREWCFDREGPEEFRRRQIYGMTDWIYEGIHFGLMMVYEWPDETPGASLKVKNENLDYQTRHERDVMNFYIAPCRDGANWDLQWVYAEQPLVPRGPNGSFDKDMVVQASNIVTWQDKHWIYYTGYRERHWYAPRKPSIGLATLPLDRFVGLQANKETGSVTTKPFQLNGGRLLLNVEAQQGAVAVEVLDAKGSTIEGFTARQSRTRNVDALRLEPTWKSKRNLSELRGMTIQLRIYLQNATLFAFQIQP